MAKNTTLCYLERGDAWLMLHRVKKKKDVNHDKWVGVGGKFEADESPEECLVREVREETGLTLTHWRWCGVVTFVSDVWETEYMYLYTADAWQGEMLHGDACAEGVLEWVEKARVPALPIWQGDALFFALMAQNRPPFSLKLCYQGDTLISAALDGKPLPAPFAL